MQENTGYTVTGSVNDDILRLAASFARQVMRRWFLDIVAECEIKEYDRTKGIYINVTVYDFEGYHAQITAMDAPHYHMRALRKHFLRDDLSHTMGVRVQGLNGGESFTIDFRDMAAIGGLTEPELATIQFHKQTTLPPDTLVNLDGFEVQVAELSETTETGTDGTVFYRQHFTVQVQNRLNPAAPYILPGKSARRNRPYGTDAASTDAVRDTLLAHQWEL